MIFIILYLTLLNFLILFFFGRNKNNLYSSLFVIINLFICLVVVYYTLILILKYKIIININMYSWIITNNLKIDMNLIFDNINIMMLFLIITISFIVNIYSLEYMLYDPQHIKFMSYLSLFTFSMIILLISNNFLLFFLGWELVGIMSYLLINFWYSRIGANKSALMAVFINKIGDISLLIGFSFIYSIIFTLDFNIFILFIITNIYNIKIYYYIAICFIIGAVGKSAQIGLHFWLPEAMEGPTPVSSLIHAATMVTAGVFLLIKVNILFEFINNNIYIILLLFGSLTTFLASSVGLFQYDLKKIIAYSTCSQLGYMFLSIGLNGFNFSLYHLINHGFFKALLFLISGYIIHGLSNEQDIRKLSGILEILPFSYISLFISNLSLIGFPFFSGYYSKEKIIELYYNLFEYNLIENIFIFNIFVFLQLISIISILFTIYYSIKTLIILFFVKFNNNIYVLKNIYLSSIITIYPLILLNIFSIFSGYILQDIFIGMNINYWFNSMIKIQNNNLYFEFINITNLITLIVILYFIIIYFIVDINNYYEINIKNKYINKLITYLIKKYIFLNKNILNFLLNLNFNIAYKYIYYLFDKGLLEIIGSFGLYKIVKYSYNKNNILFSGLLYHYIGIIIYYTIVLIFFIFLIKNKLLSLN